jgi:hypothetical protein
VRQKNRSNSSSWRAAGEQLASSWRAAGEQLASVHIVGISTIWKCPHSGHMSTLWRASTLWAFPRYGNVQHVDGVHLVDGVHIVDGVHHVEISTWWTFPHCGKMWKNRDPAQNRRKKNLGGDENSNLFFENSNLQKFEFDFPSRRWARKFELVFILAIPIAQPLPLRFPVVSLIEASYGPQDL